jgi:hypothetical protein
VLAILCSLNYAECVTESQQLFANWVASPEPDNYAGIPASSRFTIICTAIGTSGKTNWDFLWERYKSSNKAIEKYDMLRALGCSQDLALLESLLGKTLDESSGNKWSNLKFNTLNKFFTYNMYKIL